MDVINESNRVAEQVLFSTCCRLLDKLRQTKGVKAKRTVLSKFISLWTTQFASLPHACPPSPGLDRASFYQFLRLLLPQFDHARPAYGLRELSLARLYIKAFGIAPKSPVGERLLHPVLTSKSTDFADILHDVIRNRCREDSVLNLKDVNDKLDGLANSQSTMDRLAAMEAFIHLATAIEHKWIVRLISRRDSGCGLSGNSVLQCLHPAATGLWDVTQDLFMLCQRLADLDPKETNTTNTVNLNDVVLFTPFRPMLCERSNSADLLCSSALQLCSLGVDDLTDVRILLETKYDGERVQVHKSGADYRFWSRNCLEWTASYGASGVLTEGTLTPRLHLAFAPHVCDCILDGEMMAFNTWTGTILPKTYGFDVKSVRSAGIPKDEAEFCQPCFIAFDLLYLNGEILTRKTLIERKQLLAQAFGLAAAANSTRVENSVPPQNTPQCPPPLPILDGTAYLSGWCEVPIDNVPVSGVFDHLVDNRQEGMVAKLTVGLSPYLPGRRSRSGWWKLKPDYVSGLLVDLDCLIVGGYHSAPSGTKPSSNPTRVRQFLCAVRAADVAGDEQSDAALPCFYSFCRVNSGLTTLQFKSLNEKLRSHWRPYDRKNPNSGFTEWLRVTTERPDVWIAPQHSVTLQIHASEITASGSYAAGLTTRFARVVAVREDKPWQDCLTLNELTRLNNETQGKLTARHLKPPITKESDSESDSESKKLPVTTSFPDSGIALPDLTESDDLSFDEPQVMPPDIQSFGALYTGSKHPGHPMTSSTPIKKRRPLVLPMHSVRLPPDSTVESRSTLLSNSTEPFFNGLEFCLFCSADVSALMKRQLEEQIVFAGGRVVQNPSSKTFCIVADKLTMKTRNLIAGPARSRASTSLSSPDIARLSWLEVCLNRNQFVPWRLDDLFHATPKTASRLDTTNDSLGDSLPKLLNVDDVRDMLELPQDSGESSPDALSTSMNPIISSVRPLHQCCILPVHFGSTDRYSQDLNHRLMLIDLRKLGCTILESCELDDTHSVEQLQQSIQAQLDRLKDTVLDSKRVSHVLLLHNTKVTADQSQILFKLVSTLHTNVASRVSDEIRPHLIHLSWAQACIVSNSHCAESEHSITTNVL